MKIGISLWPDRNIGTLADLAAHAEDAGFDELWWPDHYDSREVSAILALCAGRTRRIRLGTAVTSVLLRHPGILASLFATLSELSGGRIVAGVGPGGFEVRTELGTWTRSPIGATRQAVAILRELTQGRVATVDGGGPFPVRAAKLSFQVPPVPIYLAGRGPRMIELAGEVADGVITHGLAESYLRAVLEWVAAGARGAGRSAEDCDVVLMANVAIDDDLQRARDTLRPRCLNMVGGEYRDEVIPLYGLDPDQVGRVRRAVRDGDPGAAELITDEMVDAFAFAGPVERVAKRLAEVANMGIRSAILGAGRGASSEAIWQLAEISRRVGR